MLIFYTTHADTELYLDPSYNTAPQGWTAQEIWQKSNWNEWRLWEKSEQTDFYNTSDNKNKTN